MRVFSKCDSRYPTGRRDLAMYYFMYFLDLRVGECVELRIADLFLERRQLGTPNGLMRSRRILQLPASDRFLVVLGDWLRTRRDIGAEGPWLFCTSTGGRVDQRNVRKTLSRHARQADIAGATSPEMMRHSFAPDVVSHAPAPLNVQTLLEPPKSKEHTVTDKGFKLEAVELPERKRHGMYDQIVTEFVASGNRTSRVTIPERSAKTVQIGLSKAVQVAGVKTVAVNIREGLVYLSVK